MASWAAVLNDSHLSPASCAVAESQKSFRPLRWTRRAALCKSPRLEDLLELASSPTLPILSATLFNQNEKFFIACWTQQRRFRDAAPVHIIHSCHELFQLAQHARMHGRV